MTVFDATGKTLVDAGKHERSASARHKEFVDTLANGEALTIRSTDVLGEYMLYSSRKVGDYVVRLAIPYRQAREAAQIAKISLAASERTGGRLSCDGLELDRDAQLVRYQQERIALTPGEYRLLEVLMSRPGRIHTRTALLDMIQLEAKDITDRTVDVMLAHMRPKLGAWAAHIETACGIGYRLVQ